VFAHFLKIPILPDCGNVANAIFPYPVLNAPICTRALRPAIIDSRRAEGDHTPIQRIPGIKKVPGIFVVGTTLMRLMACQSAGVTHSRVALVSYCNSGDYNGR
jgi:hypothetical protein